MKVCDICKKTVDVLYPQVLWRRDSKGDTCPDCVAELLKSGKSEVPKGDDIA